MILMGQSVPSAGLQVTGRTGWYDRGLVLLSRLEKWTQGVVGPGYLQKSPPTSTIVWLCCLDPCHTLVSGTKLVTCSRSHQTVHLIQRLGQQLCVSQWVCCHCTMYPIHSCLLSPAPRLCTGSCWCLWADVIWMLVAVSSSVQHDVAAAWFYRPCDAKVLRAT